MSGARGAMPLGEAVATLHAVRGARDVVITSMGSAREWMSLGPLRPLDFVFVPSSMGEAPSLALGLALAQPARRIIACNGDGSMLMNLGALVTICAEGPANLTLIVFENGIYEVTGAQPTPASGAKGGVDFAALARASGFGTVFSYDDIDQWRTDAARVIAAPGPVFILLRVAPVPGAIGPRSPGPTVDRGRAFTEALRG